MIYNIALNNWYTNVQHYFKEEKVIKPSAGDSMQKFTHGLCFVCSVPEFECSKYLVTNKDFMGFVRSGAYSCREMWTKEGTILISFLLACAQVQIDVPLSRY